MPSSRFLLTLNKLSFSKKPLSELDPSSVPTLKLYICTDHVIKKKIGAVLEYNSSYHLIS